MSPGWEAPGLEGDGKEIEEEDDEVDDEDDDDEEEEEEDVDDCPAPA